LGNLLDGEYDERESHAAFQKALDEWRGVSVKKEEPEVKNEIRLDTGSTSNANTGTQSSKTPSAAEAQLKDLLERSAVDKGLSYLDKLLLDKYRNGASEEATKEDALNQRLETLRSLTLNERQDRLTMETTWPGEEEELNLLQDESFPIVLEYALTREEGVTTTVQDITDCEEQSIQESLLAGRMIEVLPSSACVVEHPQETS
jgi:hypothetical protein